MPVLLCQTFATKFLSNFKINSKTKEAQPPSPADGGANRHGMDGDGVKSQGKANPAVSKQMKLTDVYFKTCSSKKFTNYRDLGYKFKVVRIPALKDSVTVRQSKTEEAQCVNEMTRMMDCWKRTDFNQTICSKEASDFMACMAASEAKAKILKEQADKGLPTKRTSFWPSNQVNEFLAKYPQPKSNFKD